MSVSGSTPHAEAAWHLHHGDALEAYADWPTPSAIISDGAYGIGGFPGDPREVEALPDWYRPHIEAWSEHSAASTTLWFWNTEVGWATMHPLLVEHGWEYVQVIVWNKGLAHIAGNVNGDTIRRFPVVTEVCTFYRRRLLLPGPNGLTLAKQWLRGEWQRSGLPLRAANDACGTAHAATRKYLGQDWQWYPPPPHMMERLALYANQHGDPLGAPYFSLNGTSPVTMDEWESLSHPWCHTHGITNAWGAYPLHGNERVRSRGQGSKRATHPNQKPLEFMRRIIAASTDEAAVIWEPFGGLCSAAVAAIELGRKAFAAESDHRFAESAEHRLRAVAGPRGAWRASLQAPGTPPFDAGGTSPSAPMLPLGM